MRYVDGFVIAVPTANRQAFIDHATKADAVFLEYGALRVTECWGDDVPRGTTTDFYMAVKAEADESVVFSWIEWPDKATRDAAMPKVMADPRLMAGDNPMPFDGRRMIYGSFTPVLDLGET
ncbi:DUF1428 domain-containing protein [Plastoroseomonas arctica]|uniref:DUF1428 domain-containing protein n=1 Tax=Plastoroseomonas arctica TaxID=1509237 RepID=A0AAF1KME2_9PROT|nr:DUF1428 domain-containing protein [Plastoroseomonas arctica]MBR0656261.1 DUF1428 domain-containing protein [Plastoroseomonas arctica]